MLKKNESKLLTNILRLSKQGFTITLTRPTRGDKEWMQNAIPQGDINYTIYVTRL